MRMRAENGRAGSHQRNLRGYILRPLSIPGVYERTAARMVSKTRPKFRNLEKKLKWQRVNSSNESPKNKSETCLGEGPRGLG